METYKIGVVYEMHAYIIIEAGSIDDAKNKALQLPMPKYAKPLDESNWVNEVITKDESIIYNTFEESVK